MSDSPNKPEGSGDGARKRRRRRRKPADGGANSGAAESQPSKSERPAKSPASSSSKASGEDKPARKRRPRKRGGADGGSSNRQRNPSDGKGRSASTGNSQPRQPQPRQPQPRQPQQPEAGSKEPVAKAERPVDEGWQLTPPPPADSAPEAETQDVDAAILKPGDAPWGDDSGAETPENTLAANLPSDVPSSEWDPTSAPLGSQKNGYDGQLSARVANVIAVRFVTAGRLYLFDGGDEVFMRGDRVVVDGEHGRRIATVGTSSSRQPQKGTLKRILRRATPSDLEPDREEECRAHLRTAKDLAKKQGLAIKVFRAQFDGPKRMSIYYACEQKADVRGLGRALSNALPVQVELRHTGARDEAKMVGGIGSCGQELCCTTWLPAFVPVSIKNAKDQGLVLNPTKVSGQCGRLKCCLVYEQAHYSEMRKGLPKLGKRVVTNDGFEGRVIEVDVLHQKIRVGIGRGESKVYGKGEVEPMFASQPQTQGKAKKSKQPSQPGEATAHANNESSSSNSAPSNSPTSDVTKEASNDKD